jgi:Cft2 family RNA processing exonuclease
MARSTIARLIKNFRNKLNYNTHEDRFSRRRNTILIVGYCEPSSLGGQLMNNAKQVKIMGEDFKVSAEVIVMRSMSAHGDSDDLLRFFRVKTLSW